ncbi:hypothetical protein LUZ63_004443 [Rhynchospora breviuscula]|uniref:Uncharacterized protein n=1 Tax=Rhynchospora breviuscula TaxID=2022672 RepID=A0A9Q0D2P1_9POAL|nr:hypothetical protein LUZ63_004443 [Rhynchospora breviuscula]
MEREASLEITLKQRLQEDLCWMDYISGSFTIFRIPTNVRESNKDLYEPRMVSIGPYYNDHRRKRLKSIEDQKWRLFRSFLGRNTAADVESYVRSVKSLEDRARQCYSECVDLRSDEFVQMLLFDGCFILELFYKWLCDNPDSLFKEGWGPSTIISDLLLFENQIPFFVIEKLHNIVQGETSYNRDVFLSRLAGFLTDEQPSQPPRKMAWPETINHLLDLYHYFIVPTRHLQNSHTTPDSPGLWKRRLMHWITPRTNQMHVTRPPRQVPCATDLYETAIKFTKKRSPEDLFDVTFERGVLQIPPLKIDSNQKTLFTNLIALEKHKADGRQIVTSYVALMDSLINTKEDVALLQRFGVIHNMLSSHQEAAIFFNNLGDGASFDYGNHYFADLFTIIQQHHDSNWNRSWARLLHDYFNSPWAVISVVAAMILLGLSTLQTIFTVYPYFKPSQG